MKKLLTPKNDFVFKKLFTTDTEILANLINCALGLAQKNQIVSVEIKNPGILPDEIEKKFIILDIRAIDGMGNEYDIEIQVRRYADYPKRALYYLCKIYCDQLKAGETYQRLHPVIGIHFLDYEQFPDYDDFNYHFQMKDIRYPGLSLSDNLSLHIFELPGIQRLVAEGKMDEMAEWIYFFNHAPEEGDETMRNHYKNPMIHRAFQALEALSEDEIIRELAERREKALKDEAMFLNEAKRIGKEEGEKEGEKKGLKKGREENRKETILKLLNLNILTDEQIAEATGTDIKEVRQLR